jgi:hypothetical protein
MLQNSADLKTLPDTARFQKAVFKLGRERTSLHSKNEKCKKYPCFTCFCALAKQDHNSKCAQLGKLRDLARTNGISSLSSLLLFQRLLRLAIRKYAR